MDQGGRGRQNRRATQAGADPDAGYPYSGHSCIIVKDPAGYISFCLNILHLK